MTGYIHSCEHNTCKLLKCLGCVYGHCSFHQTFVEQGQTMKTLMCVGLPIGAAASAMSNCWLGSTLRLEQVCPHRTA